MLCGHATARYRSVKEYYMKETPRHGDLVMGIMFILLSIFWFYHANRMMTVELGIGPGGYPKFVSVGLFFLGLILTLQTIKKGLPKWDVKIDWKAVLRTVIFVAVTFAYIRLMNVLGYVLLTPLYTFFACWFFGYRRYHIIAILSISVTAGIYVVFRIIFLVMLPVFRLF